MLAVGGGTSRAATACQLLRVAELPVTMANNAPLIPASIDGHAVQMLVDTGAARSLIWRSAAKELGLEIRQGSVTFYGAGGHDEAGLVWIRDFNLAGATIHNAQLFAAGRGNSPADSAGIVGDDFLSAWDVEFDLSAGKIRFFTPRNCKGDDVAYWASAYSVLDLVTPPAQSKWLEAKVQLDGHDVIAMFDSGASTSVVTTQAVLHSGIRTETAATETAASKGIAGKAMDTSVALFGTLSVGDETVRNVELRIADLFSRNTAMQTGSHLAQHVTNDPEMLIGADFFLSHRMYVARSQDKMYFTYQGGPIFRHKSPEAGVPAAAPPSESGSTAP